MKPTGNIDPNTGLAEYVHDDGTSSWMSDVQAASLGAITPTISIDPTVAPAYSGPPTTLTSASSGLPAPSTGLEHVTAGLLGTTPETLRNSGQGLNPTKTPATIVPTIVPTATPSKGQIIDIEGGISPVPLGETSLKENNKSSETSDLGKVTTIGKLVPGDLTRAHNELFKQQVLTEEKQGLVDEKIADAQFAQATAQANMLHEQNEQDRIKRESEALDIAEKHAKLESLTQEYQGMQLDSGRYWANKSTGNKILAAIGVAFGALGQMQGETTNAALDIVNRAVDQDIKEQEFNISKSGQALDKQRGMYTDYLRQVGDERTARLLTHKSALDAVATQFLAIQASNNSALAQITTKKNIQDITAKKLILDTELRTRTEERVKETGLAKTKNDKAPYAVVDGSDAKILQDAADAAEIWHGLEKIQNTWQNQDVSGPVTGRAYQLAVSMGIPIDAKGYLESRTATDMARFKLLKAITGAGVNVKEMESYEKVLPSILNNPDHNKAITAYLKDDYTKKYENVRKGVGLKYQNDERVLQYINTAFPSYTSKVTSAKKK